ncbi:hypothetical protein MNBD_GAMMA19-2054, partial [hydrothermal vent metagenome]
MVTGVRFMKAYFMWCAGLLLAGLLLGAAQAQAVEAEGTSPINGPVGVAKRLALQDAIRQALLQ